MTDASRRDAEKARTAARQLQRLGDPAWLDGNGEDEIWSPRDICEIFDVTMNTVYKLNAHRTIKYRHFGKHCRYLRSDVLSYFMGRDVDAVEGEPIRKLPLEELPRIFARKRAPKVPKKRKPEQEPEAA